MASDQFNVEEPKKSGSGCTTVLIGCLVIALVLAGVACGVGYYALSNLNRFAANIAESAANEMIDQTDLPEEQKKGMKEQISRVAKGYRDGEVSFDQVTEVLQKLGDSPAIIAIPIEVVRSKYIKPSGLSDEEKADATKQMERVGHGVFDKKISEDELKALLNGRLADEDAEGKLQFRDHVSDEELRKFIKAAKELADSKDIPDQEYKIDLAAELKKAVDEVLEGHSDEAQDINIDVPAIPNDGPKENEAPMNATEPAGPAGN